MKRPTLVLMPGMHGTARLTGPFIDVVGDRHRVSVAWYPPDRPLGYRELLPIARQAIPNDGDYVLVAESFSGPLAVELAATMDRPPRALVFAASFAADPMPPGFRLLLGPARIAFRFPQRAVVARYFLTGHDAPDDEVRTAVAATRSVRHDVLHRRLADILATDVRETLRALPVPVLYLAGARDRLIGRRGQHGVRAARPDATVADIDGPHLLLFRRPQPVFDEIERFLTRIG